MVRGGQLFQESERGDFFKKKKEEEEESSTQFVLGQKIGVSHSPIKDYQGGHKFQVLCSVCLSVCLSLICLSACGD